MNNLNFEVGKAYQTRDGRKAVCLTTTLYDKRIGLQVGEILYSVTINGMFFNDKSETQNDIISEWIDNPVIDWDSMPAWAKFVAMDSGGGWWWYEKEPIIGEITWRTESEYYDEIPTEYAPKWEGDWKNSLIERP
jgi:hypothetical protein